ncbi:SPOR domain-containing protein [Yoonia sp. BS5-3]|uniref:SPOR domain-containing protein n=1 Tax=Yoonia phaeophyticola TaxID=3137369 RepID=A0ABZ2V135_9RHOB
MAVYDEGFAPANGASRAGILVNYAGAAMSLALILGVSVWGYKLIMRDVSGIPVVRAMEGDMRVLPDNPGGDVALHTGLAVNEVAALGEAGGPEDRLVLAPVTSGLAQEDLDAQPVAEVIQAAVTTDAPAITAPTASEVAEPAAMSTEDILALADEVAALSEAPAAEPVAEALAEAASVDETPEATIIPASIPGVALSLRPNIRPASLRVPAPAAEPAVAAAPAEASNDEVAVSTASFAPGTNLVQLGAFTSPALAAAEWERLQDRFGDLMANKFRVIQVSNQAANTWYRLRASGFDDRATARRFCAALEAEGADCIAVVVD